MHTKSQVALKLLLVQEHTPYSSRSTGARIAQQLQGWTSRNDPGILSPLGLANVGGAIYMVNPWYDGGNLRQYLLEVSRDDLPRRISLVSLVCRLSAPARDKPLSFSSKVWLKAFWPFTLKGGSIPL